MDVLLYVMAGKTRGREPCLIFLVNSPKETMFIESVAALAYSKTGEKLFELLDKFIEKIGEENVVQVVTDSAASDVLAGKNYVNCLSH